MIGHATLEDSLSARRTLEMPDAEVILDTGFFPRAEADAFLAALTTGIAWQTRQIRIYGRTMDMPRLTAWYGDSGRNYTYSGITEIPLPWTSELRTIRERVAVAAGTQFNSVLLNHYRGERDSMSWHSDDETELGRNPVIASVTFGASRKFQFKHRLSPEHRMDVELTHGSLLIMAGPTQHYWKHQL